MYEKGDHFYTSTVLLTSSYKQHASADTLDVKSATTPLSDSPIHSAVDRFMRVLSISSGISQLISPNLDGGPFGLLLRAMSYTWCKRLKLGLWTGSCRSECEKRLRVWLKVRWNVSSPSPVHNMNRFGSLLCYRNQLEAFVGELRGRASQH